MPPVPAEILAIMQPIDLHAADVDNQADLRALAARFPGKMQIVNGRLRVAR